MDKNLLQLDKGMQKVVLFLAVIGAAVGVYMAMRRFSNALSTFAQA